MNPLLNREAFGSVLDELLMLFSETAGWHKDPAVRSILQEAVRRGVGIRSRLERAQDRYVVSVVGLCNVGKSTLLNALLGDELAPRRNGPCTTAPIEFEHSDSLSVRVGFRERLERPTWKCGDAAEVHDRLAELAAIRASDDRIDQIQKVIVGAPLELLRTGLVIADTPGFGVGQTAEDGNDDGVLERYLRSEVSQVFWVVLAEQGIGRREADFHETLFADLCDDIVVTGSEDFDSNDRERFRRRFTDLLQRGLPPRMFFVSGKQGLAACRQNDEGLLEQSGVPELARRIQSLANSARRLGYLRRSLVLLASDVRAWFQSHRDTRGRLSETHWRPDSWDRWRALSPDNRLKRRVETRLNGN